ncbi:ATP-binding protein [Streptomyces sp. NPDC090442]|uniref:ATP-binding protein n=1 Tax=Streptomyces sp. NPDC090442 TaxID=3365962 RepID=UPI0037F46527
MLLHASYAATPAHVPVARGDVSRTLRRHGITARADDTRLLVSELITNAIGHSPGADVTVTVRSLPGGLVVAVSDACPTPPRRRRPSADDERGRGLQLLELLADAWGFDITSHGTKVVWCRIHLSPPTRIHPEQENTQ